MKNLKSLTDYIKAHKYFGNVLAGDFDGCTIPVTDYGYDSSDKTFYFFCDGSFEEPAISAKSILKEVYRYPVISIALICEELSCIKDVKSISHQFGNGSFGEPDYVVME